MKTLNHFRLLAALQLLCLSSNLLSNVTASEGDDVDDVEIGSALDPHPDPNDENYDDMIYIGRHDEQGHRVGFDVDNGTVSASFPISFLWRLSHY